MLVRNKLWWRAQRNGAVRGQHPVAVTVHGTTVDR